MNLAVLLFAATGHAMEVGGGVQAVVNDPFLRQRGLVVAARHHLTQSVSVGLLGTYYPDRDTADWTKLTTQLVEENSVSPDLSKQGLTLALPVGIDPLYTRVGQFHIEAQLYVGPAVIRTKDDLAALQAEGDERAESTQFQTHLGSVFGFTSDLFWTDKTAVRFRIHRQTHIETVSGTTLEMKGNFMLGAEFVYMLSAPPWGRVGPSSGGAP